MFARICAMPEAMAPFSPDQRHTLIDRSPADVLLIRHTDQRGVSARRTTAHEPRCRAGPRQHATRRTAGRSGISPGIAQVRTVAASGAEQDQLVVERDARSRCILVHPHPAYRVLQQLWHVTSLNQ